MATFPPFAEASLVIRKTFIVNIASNELSAQVEADTNESFLPFDEERYLLIRSDGSTEALSGDKLSVLQQFFTFAQQHGMIWVGLDIESCQQNADKNKLNYLGSWSGLMALTPDGSKGLPYESETDKLTAQYFGARIAKITKGLDL